MENRRDLGDFWVRVEIWNLGLVYEKGKLGLSIERERERGLLGVLFVRF